MGEIYERHISITNAVGIDKLNKKSFEKRLDHEIGLVSNKVFSGTYRFSQYKEKLISKGADKLPRVVSIPTFRDRITLRALCNVLSKTYESDIDSRLPQHVIKELRDEIKSGNFTHFIKLDVKSFYPSIPHDLLFARLRKRIRKSEIKSLIESAVKTPTVPYPDRGRPTLSRGVPQGLSISNLLAEIYLSSFDSWAKNIPNSFYVRYVDDILMLVRGNPLPVFNEMRDRLFKDYSLECYDLNSNEKSACGDIGSRFQFLGYEFFCGNAGIKEESIRRIEASLAKIFTSYKYRCASALSLRHEDDQIKSLDLAWKVFLWRLNLRISGCLFDGIRRGWVFYFSQIDDSGLRQLHHLDKTVRVLSQRFSVDFKVNELKSFVRSFHEASRSNLKHRYIPNFDSSSISEQRELLGLYGLEKVAEMSDDRIVREFRHRIRRETSLLELDIQGKS